MPELNAPPPRLTPTEVDILDCLAKGYHQTQIAVRRRTSKKTVEKQMLSLRRKLGGSTAAHCVALGFKHKFITIEK
jgi:DNA-binding CsgD family transcriptional regulator